MQRALLQFGNPSNHALVKEALLRCHREDLIGHGKNCLITPVPFNKNKKKKSSSNGTEAIENNKNSRNKNSSNGSLKKSKQNASKSYNNLNKKSSNKKTKSRQR